MNQKDITMTHFGAANWRIETSEGTILVDPYFSRHKVGRHKGFGQLPDTSYEGDTRPTFAPDDVLVSNTELAEDYAPTADYILITHSHFNHCMDTPQIAMRTGATIVGSESTINVARAYGVPESQLIAVHGGEDYKFTEALSIRAVPSLHSPLNNKHYFESGTIPPDIQAPLRAMDYVEGGTLAYLIRIGENELLVFGSMNYIENEIRGLTPNVVLVASAPDRKHIYQYTERLLKVLSFPEYVVATHWDRQAWPYGIDQSVTWAEALEFAEEARSIDSDAHIVLPPHFGSFQLSENGISTDTCEIHSPK